MSLNMGKNLLPPVEISIKSNCRDHFTDIAATRLKFLLKIFAAGFCLRVNREKSGNYIRPTENRRKKSPACGRAFFGRLFVYPDTQIHLLRRSRWLGFKFTILQPQYLRTQKISQTHIVSDKQISDVLLRLNILQ